MILALSELQTGQVLASMRLWQYVQANIGTMANAPPEILKLAKDGAHARMSMTEIDELCASLSEQVERQEAAPLDPALRIMGAWIIALPPIEDEA